jgi:hypothetical protein
MNHPAIGFQVTAFAVNETTAISPILATATVYFRSEAYALRNEYLRLFRDCVIDIIPLYA